MSTSHFQIISDPPLIEPVFPHVQADAIYELIRQTLGRYQRILQSDRKHLLEQFTLVQVARKVVGSAASAPAAGSR